VGDNPRFSRSSAWSFFVILLSMRNCGLERGGLPFDAKKLFNPQPRRGKFVVILAV
jgi:hypothetical protein